jgi:Zn-dependent peptidase ImmA (M78 family)
MIKQVMHAKATRPQALTHQVLGARRQERIRTPLQRAHDALGNHGVLRVCGDQVLRAKLLVGAPGDVYEQEADRVAAHVMRGRLGPPLQLHAAAIPPSGVAEAPPIVEEALRSPGRPLDSATRAFMEPRLGRDLSDVRLHTDTKAAESARAVNAVAYTVGDDVVFGPRHTPEEHTLLAHELTHAIQQDYGARSVSARSLRVGGADDASAAEVDHTAQAVIGGLYRPKAAWPPPSGTLPLRRKVSADIRKIRANLSRGLFDWAVREGEVREVLTLLKPLNDEDLKDTLAALEPGLVDRIFSKVSKADAASEAALLDRIRQLRPGKTLLMNIPSVPMCDEPPKGPYELARRFGDLSDLVTVVRKIATGIPAPAGPRLLRRLGILAHGDAAGVIQIGSTVLNVATIDQHKGTISSLAGFLTPDADVYIYGCISGYTKPGSALLKELSLLLPGRRIIGFNTITTIPIGEAKVPGQTCLWPDLYATDIRSEIYRGQIKVRVPATDTAPQAKIAQDGKITRWPSDEVPARDDGTKESERGMFEKTRRGTLQRAAMTWEAVGSVPPIVHEVLQSPGRPLDQATRAFMEARFGHDFRRVRIHRDARAAQSAQALNARAYTIGRDVVFGTAQYAPDTNATRRLLAHELAHVVQQRETAVPPDIVLSARSDPRDLLEREAENIACSTATAVGKEPIKPFITKQVAHVVQRQVTRAFTEEQFASVRQAFEENAKAATRASCIAVVNTGLRKLFGAQLKGKPLGSEMEKTMARLNALHLADQPVQIEFQDARGRITKGTLAPDMLSESPKDRILGMVGPEPGYYLFGLSIMDGYHSVLLAVDSRNPADRKIYWMDQIYSGLDDVTEKLDDRITRLTKDWWNAVKATKGVGYRTITRIWPIVERLMGDFPVSQVPRGEMVG